MTIMEQLTNRQKEVTSLVAQGKTQHEIASELKLSKYTVINYLRNAREKTGCRSSVELAVKFSVELAQLT